MMKYILSTILVVFLLNIVVESKSNYLYSVTSNINPLEGQDIFIYDVTTSLPIFNQTVSIPYQIESILYVDKFFDKIVFLALQNLGGNKVMVEFYVKSNEFKLKSSISEVSLGSFTSTTQQVVMIDKSVFVPVFLNDIRVPTLIEWDFNNEKLSTFDIELPNYTENQLFPPFLTNDYSGFNNLFYFSYQSNISSSQNRVSIARFKGTSDMKLEKVYYGITDLNTADIRTLFTGPKGEVYAIKNSYYASVDVCKLNFELSSCEHQLTIYLGPNTASYRFTPYFTTVDKTKLIVLATYETEELIVEVYDIATWNKTQFTIPNQWTSSGYENYSYFNYV